MPFWKTLRSSLFWFGAHQCGLEIRRYREPLRMLKQYSLRTVLDVGANAGQFAADMRAVDPSVAIHSFEPLPGPFQALNKRAQADPKLFAHQLAMGKEEAIVTMKEFAFSPASSILASSVLMTQEYEWAAKSTLREVQMTTLDQWAAKNSFEEPLLVKIDVQGYEDRVLCGARHVLSRASVLIIEVSFAQMYSGQMLFDDIYDMLRGLGFHCAGMFGNLVQENTGMILSADALFIAGGCPPNGSGTRELVSASNPLS